MKILFMLCLAGFTIILWSNPKDFVKYRFLYSKIEFCAGEKNLHVISDFDFKHKSVCIQYKRKKLAIVQVNGILYSVYLT